MEYATAKIENGKIVKSNVITVDQSKLTGECWQIQIEGLGACQNCESRGKDCGGKKIRKTGKNELGYKVHMTAAIAKKELID